VVLDFEASLSILTPMLKHIGVIGVGGVGGYFGGKLCQALTQPGNVRIYFVARGEHLRAIQHHGLRLKSEKEDVVCQPTLATDNFAELPALDLCLLCVKEFDLSAACRKLKPALTSRTIILPLLNGVDIYERVRAEISEGIVLPACVYVGTHMESPGVVQQKGGACKILFGSDPQFPEAKLEDLKSLLSSAGIKFEHSTAIQTEIWSKFIFICSYGLVSAASGKCLGEILNDEQSSAEVRGVISEALQVAEKLEVPLPADIAASAYMKARGFPYEARTSFQRDFEKPEKPDERDLFAGSLLGLAERTKVDARVTRRLSALLEKKKPAQRRA
jgi:2-dehydropantoate 2-reductase